MIQIRHFQSERTERAPSWKAAEEFMNGFYFGDPSPYQPTGRPQAKVIEIKTYPTAVHHNMLVIIDVCESVASSGASNPTPN